MSKDLWARYRDLLWNDDDLGVRLDVSRMDMAAADFEALRPRFGAAFSAMAELERGAIANPDEKRMVGHYWLRAPELAPAKEIREEIEETVRRIRLFAKRVHAGEVRPPLAERFTHLLVVGIGGSALGPQFVADALGAAADAMKPHFVDNTDPDGIDRVLTALDRDLKSTLVVVISKSGGTKETRNGMLEAEAGFRRLALPFAKHAVAVTGAGSALDRHARDEGWIDVFPMWDWVGGRTSELSAVGLLPAALQGIDIDAMLAGARAMDERTRVADLMRNPAALLAAAWYHAGNGRGDRAMVVLPYKDRLILFSRYLQQLVMESLGKEKDLAGNVVHQGIVVYGNKGSTDQHAYVQQLRDGRHDFFVTFIEVLRDRAGESAAMEDGATSGDYLLGFLLGTRAALYEKGRGSITIAIPEVGPATVGMLIALYERAVGLYASLIGINAYHQPGVEAGKKAAEAVLALERKALKAMRAAGGTAWTADALAEKLGEPDAGETLFHLLEHLAANPDRGVRRKPGATPWEATYRYGG